MEETRMKKTLENERLLIEVEKKGSQLVRIYDKEKQREVLWEGNPEFWGKHSPILFPMIGTCYNNVYRFEGQEYEMASHGFAWKNDFDFTETDGEITAVLTDSEESKKIYPFSFALTISHKLSGNQVIVSWKVENTGDKTMYYSIGAHPGFRMQEGVDKTDMYLGFPGKKELPYILIAEDGSKCADTQKVYTMPLDEDGCIKVTENFWDKDAYIYEHQNIETVGLYNADKTPYVLVHCGQFPYLGVWAKPNAPFICIEPWFGRCDDKEFTGELKDKTGICSVEAGQSKEYSYVIEIA